MSERMIAAKVILKLSKALETLDHGVLEYWSIGATWQWLPVEGEPA
jgi:hypothetical protein